MLGCALCGRCEAARAEAGSGRCLRGAVEECGRGRGGVGASWMVTNDAWLWSSCAAACLAFLSSVTQRRTAQPSSDFIPMHHRWQGKRDVNESSIWSSLLLLIWLSYTTILGRTSFGLPSAYPGWRERCRTVGACLGGQPLYRVLLLQHRGESVWMRVSHPQRGLSAPTSNSHPLCLRLVC